MGHRHSPEEVGRAGGVCGYDCGAFAAGGKSVENLPAGAYGTPPVHRAALRLALFALRFYKAYLSMLFAGSCRFEPTCSQYSYEAMERFGVAGGAWLTLKRLARCQPLSRRFGYDPVPENWPVPESLEALSSEALEPEACHSATSSREVHT